MQDDEIRLMTSKEKVLLAKNPNCPVEALVVLATDKALAVRVRVADGGVTSDQVDPKLKDEPELER